MMRLWKGSLVALMLAMMVAVMPVGAATTPPPTLSGEVLNGSNSTGPSLGCIGGLRKTVTYTVTGTATGPYSGPFTEHITLTALGAISPRDSVQFSATFTITAPNGTVTGTKSSVGPASGFCGPLGHTGGVISGAGNHAYTATIATPHGMYHDEGTGTFSTGAQERTYQPIYRISSLNETFQSRLTQTTLLAPTSKEQCKDGGYKHFTDPNTGKPFKNQGRCVEYVENIGQPGHHGGQGDDGGSGKDENGGGND